MTRADLPHSMTHQMNGDPVAEEIIAEYAETYRGKWIAIGRCPAYWHRREEEELL